MALTIVDQNGRLVPNARPSATSQIFDVTVGPGGVTVFSPDTVNISTGDTVRWTWGSGGHSVTSGGSCAADSQFCSPDDMNCPAGILSGSGSVYQHTFSQAGTYTYFCAAHCARGMVGTVNVTAACTTPPPNMVAWWPGESNARDIAGGNNGTLVNGATFASGMVGQAFSFDGINDFVQVRDSSLWAFGANDFTIDLWLNLNSITSSIVLVANDEGGGPVNKWIFLVHNGLLQFHINSAAIGNPGIFIGSTPFTPQTGVWHHVAVTKSGTTYTFYVDGVAGTPEMNNIPVPDANAALTIGQAENSGFVNGLEDEVEIFNRALSATEIAAIVNAGAAGKCKPPQPTAAFSRKTHGGAGTFDVDLNPNGTPGVECRSGGASGVYQMIVQFANPVTVAGASLTGIGSVSGFSVSGAVVTIDLNNIANAQTIVVKLTGVSDGTLSGDVPVDMGVLVGDTTGNGAVSASDVAQTKAQSGQTTTAANFRTDVNASGSISAADIALVKSKSGTILP